MVLHFGVLAFLIVGGFLAWRWRGAIYAHLAMALWACLIVAFPLDCPLTSAENFFRERAGMPILTTGFIDTYIDGVLYPQALAGAVQLLIAVVVLTSWIGYHRHWRTERGSAAHQIGIR